MEEDRCIKIDVDYEAFKEQLGEFDKKMPSIARKMMNKVNTEIKKRARNEMKSRGYDTKKDDGVYKNLFSRASKKFTAWIGFSRDNVSNYYAPFIKYGAHITPQNGEFLTFFLDGSWHKMREVTLQPKPFMSGIINEVWNGGTAEKLMEEVFQKELNKLEEKARQKGKS